MPLCLPARGTHLVNHTSLLLSRCTLAPNPLPSTDPIYHGALSCCLAIPASPQYCSVVLPPLGFPIRSCEEARVPDGPSALAYSAASHAPSSFVMLGRKRREPLPSPRASRHPLHLRGSLAQSPPPLAMAPLFQRAILVCNHAVRSLVRNWSNVLGDLALLWDHQE